MFVPFGPTTVIPSPTPLPLPTPYGTYEEAHLGVYYRMLEPTDRFAVSEGALIVTLFGSGTPAELAGLQPGDIITAVNDEPVTQTNTLGQVLNRYSPGDVINLDVSRPDGSFTVNVVLGGG
jgi:S1-C subfamily serine protease